MTLLENITPRRAVVPDHFLWPVWQCVCEALTGNVAVFQITVLTSSTSRPSWCLSPKSKNVTSSSNQSFVLALMCYSTWLSPSRGSVATPNVSPLTFVMALCHVGTDWRLCHPCPVAWHRVKAWSQSLACVERRRVSPGSPRCPLPPDPSSIGGSAFVAELLRPHDVDEEVMGGFQINWGACGCCH